MARQPSSSSQKLKYEIRALDPRTLKGRDKNARFMTAQQMKRLADNIRQDGTLTSLPLTYEHPKSKVIEIISGHHRIQAAIAAELATIDVMVIVTPMSEARLTALQLSHNAITGEDDKSILADLYNSLELEEKKYSGLTDDLFGGFDNLALAGLGVGSAMYEELRFNFLPEDSAEFANFLKRIDSYAKKRTALVGHYADFDQFFATLIAVKDGLKVQNAAIALRMMAQLAVERLEQLETAGDGDDETENEAGQAPPPAERADGGEGGDGAAKRRRNPGGRRRAAQG